MKALRGFVGSRPSTTPESLPSTSAIFPSLRKLDLPMEPSHESPLLTLTLSAPSFLDAVVKDEFSDSPLYIIETHRDRTCIHRCETDNITNVAKVQWPSRSKMISANAVALSGISIQMHGGRWRPAEEFLKFGSLFTSRKFHLPHHPHSLKWKRVGGLFTCTCSSVKGPLATLQTAYLSAPPRLRIYSSLLRDDATRNQPNYGGVPYALLDYLVATSLLLVTDIEEYLNRPGQDSGGSRSAMEAFLPSVLSLRSRRGGRGSYTSIESPSPANSSENISSPNNHHLHDDARSINSEMVSTPSSAISQYHPYSFFHSALDPDVPPVPEVPPEHQASVPPILPRSTTLPPLPSLRRTPTVRRRLPQPPGQATPITPAHSEQFWGMPSARSTPDLTLSTDSSDFSISSPQPLPTPPQHSQHTRQTSEFSRASMSLNRRQLPPQRQPPQLPIPIPPKLRDDLARTMPLPTACPDGTLSSASETSGQTGDPGSSIHEEGGRAGGMGNGHTQEFHRRFNDVDNQSIVRTSAYELPPPAYDAIDFSLPRPPVIGEGYQSFSVNSMLPPEQIS